MKKMLIKFITLATTSAGLSLAAQASGTTGDIYEIEKLTGSYGITADYPTLDNPIVNGGQEVRFVLHLAAKDADTKDSDFTTWKLKHISASSEAADDVYFPLRIGIVVSGKLRWATLKEQYLNSDVPYTYTDIHSGCAAISDFVFTYTTEPGDYAMPIVLAQEGSTEENPIPMLDTSVSSGNYAFQNNDKWWFRNDDGDDANLKLVESQRRADMQDRCGAWTNPYSDLTLAQAGFYVRTVNFTDPDPEDWEKPSEYWRSVQSNSGVTGKPATLTVNGYPTKTSTLYAWSTNEDVVIMSTGNDVTMPMPEDGSVSKTFKVATISVVGGQSVYTLPLRGVSVSDTPVDIFVSQYPGFSFNAGNGTLLQNYLTVPVKCVEAPKPGVKISFDEDASEYTYNKGEVLVAPYDTAMPTPITMYVTLSDFKGLSATDFPNGVDIFLNPKLAKEDYASVDVYSNNYITVSLDSSDSEAKQQYVHFEAGQYQVPIYLFVRGGDIKSASGIKFTPSSTNAVFDAAYTGDRTSAKINVRDAVPLLQQPEDGTTLTGDAISGFDLNVQVLDCYRDMMSTNFTVQVGNDKVTGVEFARDIATKVHFKSPGNSGDYKLAVSVIDQNGNTSTNKVSITVTVTPPKTVSADFVASSESTEAVKGTTYKENSNTTFSQVKSGEILRPIPRFTLSDANNSGSTLYAFLKPLSAAASNKVECAAFTTGVPIPLYDTQSEPNDKFRMTFLDGCADTSYLEYAIELRTGPTLDDELYTEFVAPKNVNLTVNNVEPEIVKLTFNGTPLSSDATVTVADGVPASFSLTVDDASKLDLTNATQRIVTVWRFEDDGGVSSYEYITNTVGNSVTCNHTFGGGGTTQKIEVYALDKDMDPETEQGTIFTINVNVDEAPFIYFSRSNKAGTDNRVDVLELGEDAKLSLRYLYVYLSTAAQSKFTKSYPLKVMIAYEKLGSSGAMTIDKQEIDFTSGQKGGETIAGKANWWRISLNNLDGGQLDDSVFQITATPEWDLGSDTGYIGASLEFTLDNVPPVIKPAEPDVMTTNKTVALNQEFSIEGWTVNDVTPDLTEGLQCNWYIDDTKVDGKTTMVYDNTAQKVEGLKFTSDGFHEVRLEVLDKDERNASGSNGLATRRWFYYISPTKRLEVTPFGPASASSMVSKYGSADGLGKGRVYADAASTLASDFTSTFNCNLTVNELTVYAFGYPAAADENGYPDDGSLRDANGEAGRDTAISPSGASAEAAPYFTYGVTQTSVKNEWKYDNYYYCSVSRSDETCLSTKIDGIPKPSTTANGVTKVSMTLEAYEAETDSYGKREAEVVFSREWIPSDNGGDINADGVPDVYMLKEWKGGTLLSLVYSDDVGNVSDLRDLAQTNPDEDYLPGILLGEGELGLVDGAQKSYAPIGRAFATSTELRGFAEGLNSQDLLRSTPDFNAVESNAYEKATGLKYDPATVNLAVWSPEPSGEKFARMDPTLADTDGDGFDDGWEYYFWYAAHVAVPGGDTATFKVVTGQAAFFERFDASTFVSGIPLTNEADLAIIEKRFNPCDTRAETVEGYLANDFDSDGLSDYEEYLLGTNPCHWDTDGDHMCDSWEVMACLNPLDASDKSANTDHDFMAVLKTWRMLGYWDENEHAWFFDVYGYLQEGIDYYETDMGEKFILQNVTYPMLKVVPYWTDDGMTNVYFYGRADDLTQPTNLVSYLDDPNLDEETYEKLYDTIWGYVYVKSPSDPDDWVVNYEFQEGVQLDDKTHFVMLHDQIRDIFGFDPRTAWNENVLGYVDSRWEAVPFDSTGVAQNTAAFTAYDEYLGGQYRVIHHVVYGGEDPPKFDEDPFGWIRSKTSNPSIAYSVTSETSTDTNGVETVTVTTNRTVEASIADAAATAFAQSGTHSIFTTHGADTDEDGAPDGWELYVRRNPSQAAGDEENPYKPYTTLMYDGDVDDDGLTYACEFAGTDSCNAYKDCESIYKNHPGNLKGWFNKFFPSDPDSGDTDGDMIADGFEGMGWIEKHKDDSGNTGRVAYSFLYGTPEDDGSQCIRGGGTNPLSVDTDLDGLPDPWERQYAGLTFSLAEKAYSAPEVETVSVGEVNLMGSPDISEARLIAAGILNETYDAGTIIIDGMDATWSGDALTDPYDAPSKNSMSWDPLTLTIRDVDFDHDGLQNWQEYLVQTVRHFRYDDITTPLMGRVLYEGRYNPLTYVLETDHEQKFYGFMPMQQETSNLADMATKYWTGADAAQVIAAHQDAGGGGLFNWMFALPWSESSYRSIGYMALRQHGWDRYGCNPNISYPYLLMPVVAASYGMGGTYVSTSPRVVDTDGDGMDDYYEMFHGLNPLLGSTTDTDYDVIAQAYGVPEYFNAFWNEWTHPDFNRFKALYFLPPTIPTLKLRAMISAPVSLDPVMYPWVVGTSEVDPDGDGIRNDEERILANVTTPSTTHTDPTPMWMTDASSTKSYTWQYYQNTYPVTMLPFYPGVFHITGESYYEKSLSEYDGFSYLYSYEQNEGYDTDNDWSSDGVEITKSVRVASSPRLYSDPDRRQAVYFPGKDAYVMTRDLQDRGVDAPDMLKQFTVECWIRPEAIGTDQTVIERSCYYGGNAVTKAGGVIRANFRIGISSDGRVYGMFDNNDAIESGLNQPKSCARVDGSVVGLSKWTHIALTYDGSSLILYENGLVVAQATGLSLIPANGVTSVQQNATDPSNFPGSSYVSTPLALFIGARPKHTQSADDRMIPLYTSYVDANGRHRESFANMREYYTGYVDEVRIWDGARTFNEINANYQKRLTFEEASENRTTVYQSWLSGGTRNDNDGQATLPAELIQHYNFVTLPGAVNAGDVAQTPSGFDSAVDAQAENGYKKALYPDQNLYGVTNPKGLKSLDKNSYKIEGGLDVTWWKESLIHSTVYADTRVVPWIENAVGHLPSFEGGSPDCVFQTEQFAGAYTSVTNHNLTEFVYPNEANPYQDVYSTLERYIRLFQMKRWVDETGDTFETLQNKYRYELRSRFPGTSDLLPMGGAYAKTCPQMWDDGKDPDYTGSPADAWEQTGTDDDGVGLPDWWTRYVRENDPSLSTSEKLTWETVINYNGLQLPAYQAYLIDLARGMQPDGTYDATYASTADSDGDNIPDWWEKLWGVEEYGADDDPDEDGLSNYAEYLLSCGDEPYGTEYGFPFLNPLQSRSGADQKVIDYFLPGPIFDEPTRANIWIDAEGKTNLYYYSHEYLGEIVSDHDVMEDWWELQYKNSYANTGVYDPSLDTDEDGWSNWAECRAALWCGNYVADLIDRYLDGDLHLACYPEPAIGIKPYYYGTKDVTSAQLVVRTWTGVSPRVDATFIVAPTGEGSTRLVGAFREDTVMRGFLTPGLVQPSSVVFEKALTSSDRIYTWSYEWYIENAGWSDDWRYSNGTFEEYKSELLVYPHIELTTTDLEWEQFAISVGDASGVKATLMHGSTATTIGSIDLRTGEWSLDTAKLAACDENGDRLTSCLLRITHTSHVGSQWPQAVWLSDTQEFGQGEGEIVGKGRVKEGLNTIEVFFDLDASGTWTEGEPYGMLKNVDIGWHRTPELAVELKDEGAVMPHIALESGSENTDGEEGGETAEENTKTFAIRRTAINGQQIINGVSVPQRILVTRDVLMDDRAYLTEADVIDSETFDLDSTWLVRDATDKLGLEKEDISTVDYAVEIVTKLSNGGQSNVVVSTFTKTFNTQRSRPVVNSPTQSKPVYSNRPTFAFTSSDATMTAYRLQVFDSTDVKKTNIWDSGVVTLPARTGLDVGVYAYTVSPELYADCPTPTNRSERFFFDGSNYYWRVALLNAKFNDTDDASCWSDLAAFQMDVGNQNRYPNFATGYGSVAAAVRYFGPKTNLISGEIVVEAFENADFTGAPLARQRISDTSLVGSTNDIATANALLRGIEPGTVYLRAYIDQNNNNKRDDWESWGYANSVGKSVKAIYNPEGFEVINSLLEYPKCVIYIEDCDTNGNEIPDCLETMRSQDSDNDGLSDDDENSYGTDPTMWDTDGDGMPDGWEKHAKIHPKYYDAEEVAAGDMMAYAEVAATLVWVKDNTDTTKVYMLAEGEAVPSRGDPVTNLNCYTTYNYQVSNDGKLEDRWGVGRLTNLTNGVIDRVSEGTVVLVHAQVYAKYGFESMCAVDSTEAVHTKEFTALDKYLVVRYLEAIGLANEEQMNINGSWSDFTLMPLEPDSDEDGVADGWELYVMFGPEGYGSVTSLKNVKISPWNYSDARVASPDGDTLMVLQEYNQGVSSTDPWNENSILDDIVDSLVRRYNLATGDLQLADDDNDGLSNWAEYLAYLKTGKNFKIDDPCSVEENVYDYFVKTGDGEYVGEALDVDGLGLITDHDFMEDAWENLWDPSDTDTYLLYANRYVYDANGDSDEDGWKNWAECRAYMWGCGFYSDIVDTFNAGDIDSQVRCFPQPAIGLKISYDGNLDASWRSLVVRVRRSNRTQAYPDAIFEIDSMRKASDGSSSVDDDESSNSTGGMEKTQVLGVSSGMKYLRGYLNPGLVVPSSAKFEFTKVSQELTYYWHCTECKRGSGSYYDYKADITEHGEAKTDPNNKGVTLDETKPSEGWTTFATSAGGSDGRHGVIYATSTNSENSASLADLSIGTIDYRTGEFTLDLDRLTSEYEYDFDGKVFRAVFTYNLGAYWPQTVWLSSPEKGYVREGKNDIEAFLDLDEDGLYDIGEPYGVLKRVNIGWQKTPEMRIELKDGTSNDIPMLATVSEKDKEQSTLSAEDVTDGSVDSVTINVDQSKIDGGVSNKAGVAEFTVKPDGNGMGRLSIVRETVNGVTLGISRRVFTKKINVTYGKVYTLADFIVKGQVDMDSRYLVYDAAEAGIQQEDIRTVVYGVYWNDEQLYTFTRQFDTEPVAPLLTTTWQNSYYEVMTAQPEFSWSVRDGYRAFVVQVSEKEDFSSILYAATNLLPAASTTEYTFKPDLYVGEGLKDQSTYYWRVAQLNAKFTENVWSKVAKFTTSIDSRNADTGYGKLSAEVRYYGASEAALDNVVVGVYESGDFCCAPIARLHMSGSDAITTLVNEGRPFTTINANVNFDGIVPGEYYVMAFVDTNGNGVRDAYETWGYACKITTEEEDIYTPVTATVVSTKANTPKVLIVMEDTDVNQDKIPDSLQDMTGWDEDTVDSDGDGLTDDEEDGFFSDPEEFDTDGDGMPDGWEVVFGDTDPLTPDADYVVEGDAMAYAEVTCTTVKVLPANAPNSQAVYYIVPTGEAVPSVGDNLAGRTLFATYRYGSDDDYVFGLGRKTTLPNNGVEQRVIAVNTQATVALVHAQVYSGAGLVSGMTYNSLTATAAGLDDATSNTKAFTALDKYLVIRYFDALGLCDEAEVNANSTWSQWSLKAGVIDGDWGTGRYGDGIADGWELYVMFGPEADLAGTLTKDQMQISPWNYKDRESDLDGESLKLVYEYDGGNCPTDPWNVDTDDDNVTDYYAYMYGLKGGDSDSDYDGDGLSNYVEYLISEVFQVAKLDPNNAKTDSYCNDYFRKMGELYLGEIFTDHDQVDNEWETTFSLVANAYAFDPSRDDDKDGWSNYAEARANTDPTVASGSTLKTSEGEYAFIEHPVPIIQAKVTCNAKGYSLSNIVFKAWNEMDAGNVDETSYLMTAAADATWTFSAAESASHTKYLGRKPTGDQRYLLGGGSVVGGTVKLNILNQNYTRVGYASTNDTNTVTLAGSGYTGSPEDAQWYLVAQDYGNGDVLTLSGVKIGEIDYKTGILTLDFSSPALTGTTYGSLRGTKRAFANILDGESNLTSYDRFTFEGSHVLVSWSAKATGPSVDGTYYLAATDSGAVREGANTFICYATEDGETYVPGAPFAVVRGVDVGWQGAQFDIELTRTSAITPRIDIWGESTSGGTEGSSSSSSSSSASDASDRAATLDEVNTAMLQDRLVLNNTNLVDFIVNHLDTSNPPAEGKRVRVRVVRYGIDDMYCYVAGVYGSGEGKGYEQKVVLDKMFDPSTREFICEGDFLDDDHFDIDWSATPNDGLTGTSFKLGAVVDASGRPLGDETNGPMGAGCAVTNMTYIVVIGNGRTDFRGAADTNTVRALSTVITRRFEKDRSLPVVDPTAKTFYSARPTFTWSMPNEEKWASEYGSSYTAFRLQIIDAEDLETVIYDSGVKRAPVQDADGNFVWTAPVCAGSLTAQGKVFEPLKTYLWHVTMYNAKYRSDKWSSATQYVKTYGTFTMDVNVQQEVNDHNYSSIGVAVKYTGPSTVLSKVDDLTDLQGKVYVQAFATADFSGNPLAEAVVTDSLADVMDATPNATLIGLAGTGRYYIRAYIDQNGNGKKDDWESWGQLNESVVLNTSLVKAPVVGLYIEDSDTDQDWLPDSWEYAVNGWTGDFADIQASDAVVAANGVLAVTDNLRTRLDSMTQRAGLSTGLAGASLTLFQNTSFAAALLGLGTDVATFESIRSAVEAKVKENTLRITSLTLAQDKIVMTVDADVSYEIAGMALNLVYDLTQYADVTVHIYKKNTLVDANWQLVSEVEGSFKTGQETVEISLKGEGIDFSSGFYKVEVVK